MGPLASAGFFGKMPSRGDFVSRRLSPEFVARWDAWLTSGIAASRASLGDDWLDVYLTSPIWRFLLAPGVCGPEGHLGVVVPSVDRVGRYFPLVAALRCTDAARLAAAREVDTWLAQVEDLLLATLRDDPLDLDEFDERLADVAAPLAYGAASARPDVRRRCAVPAGRRVWDTLWPQLWAALGSRLGPYGVWWTEGSERVAASVLIATDLPEPDAFTAMLDGRFSEHGWDEGAASGSGSAGDVHASAARLPACEMPDE